MKEYFLFFISMFFCLLGFSQTPTPPSNTSYATDFHWHLKWHDEFDSTAINTNIWGIANNFNHNGEPEIYTSRPDNVFLLNGNLVLRVLKETYGNYEYTSGAISTWQIPYDQQYGYIEAKIALPDGRGLWPAFWLWDSIAGNYNEIDIFEMIPGYQDWCQSNLNHSKNTMTSSYHLTSAEPACLHGAVSTIQDFTQPHVYGIEWSPVKVIYYVDDYPVRIIQNSQLMNTMHVILNLAIQGKNGAPLTDNTTPFPSDMIIEYVRVYELNKDCNDYINSSQYDFSTYNNVEKSFIKIGEGGGSNALSVNDNVTIRASEYIELSGDFHVPVGAYFYADANGNCSTAINVGCTQTFNPCTYNFAYYDNSVKKNINLGGGSCNIAIIPANNNLLLEATDQIILKPGVIITPITGKSIDLTISICH